MPLSRLVNHFCVENENMELISNCYYLEKLITSEAETADKAIAQLSFTWGGSV